jgi:hypothetical protein
MSRAFFEGREGRFVLSNIFLNRPNQSEGASQKRQEIVISSGLPKPNRLLAVLRWVERCPQAVTNFHSD